MLLSKHFYLLKPEQIMKLNYKWLILCLALAGASCEKGLQPEVYNAISPENFLKTEGDVKTAVTGIYYELRGGGWERYTTSWGGWLTQGIGCTDEWTTNWSTEQQTDFLWRAETDFCGLFYKAMLPAVTKATGLIAQIAAAPVSDELKSQYTAELRAIRALIAFDLYDQYGPLPIIVDPKYVLDPILAQSYKPGRPEASWYVDFLESELKTVAGILPVYYDNSGDYGRLTKGAALMVLLKLYMHEKQWDKAEAVTKEIMDLKHYELQKDYASIWSPSNQHNKEIIFSISSAPTGGYGNNFLAEVLPPDYVSRTDVPLTRWNGFRLPWGVWDTFDPKDKRRERMVRSYWNGSAVIDGRTVNTYLKLGAIPMKYQENPSTDGTWDASEYVIYRYADVLLCRAEALNETKGGPTKEAIDLVNALRDRGDVKAIKLEDFNQLTFRDRILQERQWELCFEGGRRQDLIRHGKLISNAKARGKIYADPKHVLYPIPQSAINENPNLIQNDGY
jgi:hypothetical protein